MSHVYLPGISYPIGYKAQSTVSVVGSCLAYEPWRQGFWLGTRQQQAATVRYVQHILWKHGGRRVGDEPRFSLIELCCVLIPIRLAQLASRSIPTKLGLEL